MIDQILELDREITLAINGSNSLALDAFALIVTSTIAWIPIALYMLWYVYRKNGLKTMLLTIGGILLCVLIADTVSSGIFKPLVARWRPSRDPEIMYLVDIVNDYRGGRYGFFSSHASNTCSVATFLALQFRSRHLCVMFVLFTLINCWSRMYLGVHYFGDIFVGLCFGVLVGLVVFKLYSRLGGTTVADNKGCVFVANLSTYVAFLLLIPFVAASF